MAHSSSLAQRRRQEPRLARQACEATPRRPSTMAQRRRGGGEGGVVCEPAVSYVLGQIDLIAGIVGLRGVEI